MHQELIMITGRTALQGRHLHGGKQDPGYLRAVSELEMNAEDVAALGLLEGQPAVVHTVAGRATVTVKAGPLPAGMVFLAIGPVASSLMSCESEGTGMPLLKGVWVHIAPMGGREQTQ